MSRIYDVIADYGFQNDKDADIVQLNPYAILAFFRYRYPVTYSRANQGSFNTYLPTAIELRPNDPLIVVNDIVSVSVTDTKANHVMTLTAQLKNGYEYQNEIMGGDYCFCWLVQTLEQAQSIVKRLNNGDPCNGWLDGLKFYGKVGACVKDSITLDDGKKMVTYQLNAAGFTEFDASIYYEPYLALKQVGLVTEMLRTTGVKINDIIAKNGQGIAINKAIPVFLEAFYGKGVPHNKGIQGGPQITSGLDNPNSFPVPGPVAKVFGVTQGSKPHGLISFADILEVVHGVQEYGTTQDSTDNQVIEFIGSSVTPTTATTSIGSTLAANTFMPDNITSDGRIRYTGTDQMGTFLPQVPQFTGQVTVWSILSQYLNPVVNEMYTSLRVNPDGVLMPTLTVRQTPFSSGILSSTYTPRNPLTANDVKQTPQAQQALAQALQPRNLTLTRFTTLPRWRIHPVLVKRINVSRSDALRFNFIHIQGEDGLPQTNKTYAFVRDPPIRDELDITRSGLRPYMATVRCAPADIVNRRAGEWMYVMADILMGQHLTLTGVMDCYGIQSPICKGDNVEVDNTLFHIEQVTHTFNCAVSGHKTFRTSLALTHGVNAKQSDSSDLSLYSGIAPGMLTTYDPQVQTDYAFDQAVGDQPGELKNEFMLMQELDLTHPHG